ncbi:hypothetical protein NEMBOFW57_003537 [Staphylotrichum longicolle]|uniref:Glycosyl transferase CAP10 domain-containing protein n=1 Tax=Staphylotrichum longicolle TaxID=669026 RepID=A0AAD4F547_9PEZI|nr:hypothetical protein NEMBOFW57_003537 [Staphylotrichum longicolle]
MALLRRPSTFRRYLVAAFLSALTVYLLTQTQPNTTPWRLRQSANKHPIDGLVQAAEKEFAAKLSRETHTLSAAAAAYRKRRGRHPPPGFDIWYEFATENNALIVEDFWDQIYHDLEPFWGVNPAQIRKDAREFEMRIEIRNGKASTSSDWFWTLIWLDMIQTIEHLLPDMDLALNAMDEPRVVVPWEEMDVHLKRAVKTKKLANPRTVVSEFSNWREEQREEPVVEWEHDKHYWAIARRGCPPKSLARQAELITDFDKPPFIASTSSLVHMQDGYVANYTLSTDFCHQPDLQALEGVFVEPISTSATSTLLPLFGGSKLSVNNDILLPAPIYWKEEERFIGAEGASIPWSDKHPSALWRGVATGGRNRATNWRAFQRHRFVAMNNATMLSLAASRPTTHPPPNFALPAADVLNQYNLPPLTPTLNHERGGDEEDDLPTWLSKTTDIAFTDLMCANEGFGPSCDYTAPFFAPAEGVPMAAQFRHNLPVKATLWREWHDARLVAWRHFVPMDGRFGDWWGILRTDRVAERIALGGREWAGRVLRKEDMAVYVLRLLLEYARVGEERREVMGWVGI